MKNYTYTEDQMNAIYKYLISKPMIDVEKLVTILRNPVKVTTTDEEKSKNVADQSEKV